MAMRVGILVLLIATLTMMSLAPWGHGIPDKSPQAVEEWFENLPNFSQRLSKFHFFFHDLLSGPNQSVVLVAQPDTPFPNGFGKVNVVDEVLTHGPDYNSQLFGRSQGLSSIVSKEDGSYLDSLSVVFRGGRHNGSTLSVLGRIDLSEPYIEFPVVGGTGDFRLAQGIFTASIHSVDQATGQQTVECHAVVLHYS